MDETGSVLMGENSQWSKEEEETNEECSSNTMIFPETIGTVEENGNGMNSEIDPENSSEKIGIEELNNTNKELEISQFSEGNGTDTGTAVIDTETTKQNLSEISENKSEEISTGSSETIENRGNHSSGKIHSQGLKHYIPHGWAYHGESDGYRYYVGCSGEMYSVDRDGYWYVQDSSGNFVPYTGYQYSSRAQQSSLFPRDSQGRFTLPTNARGEKTFPVDVNNMPIFPFDATTHLPTFPVDENGQPVFPTGSLGRPIVPVDTNGLAIFPRDANGRFIFPSGPNGKPTAPINIYGIPVMPLDEQGKPVVPYDASGTPLIHLAADGITPLTEEEYQYSLQLNDYYSRYYKNAAEQKTNSSHQAGMMLTTTEDTYEQKAKNMRLLKKVRPEDIDLPPTVPPPPATQPPPPAPDGSALPMSEVEKSKTAPDPALKAKTKKMIEMQLKFSRKKLRDTNQQPSTPTVSSGEMTDIPVEHAPVPLQPCDQSEFVDKIESPEERPPPPPLPATPPLVSAEPEAENDNGIGERSIVSSEERSKSKESHIAQKLGSSCTDDSGPQEQAAIPPVEVVVGPSNVTGNLSGDAVENLEHTKSSENKIEKMSDEHISSTEDMDVACKKQTKCGPEDVTNGTNAAVGKQSGTKDDIQEDSNVDKVATKMSPSADNSTESKSRDQTPRKKDERNERSSLSREKHVGKSRHHNESKERKRSGSRHRRSRSRSSYRDSRRRSRSRGVRHRSRTHSRTPQRDYYYRGRYRSRSRDRFYRYDNSSYYDRRGSYRRHWTPDTEHRRRRSSSRDRSSRREKSTSRDRSPTADKSSRSRSYYDRSKSRSASVASVNRNRNSSRRDSPDVGFERSPRQSTENLTTVDDVADVHKSASRSASPRSEKSSGKGEIEMKSEKSKKHKKSKEKHRKRRKSHHKRKDKRKRSLSVAESGSEGKRKTPSTLSDETDFVANPNTCLNEPTEKEAGEISSTKGETRDSKKEKTKKKKEKKKKKEHRNSSEEGNGVTMKISQETLEEGEIVTEKEVSPRGKMLVSYATSESDGEENDARKSKGFIEQPAESRSMKVLSSTNSSVNSSNGSERQTVRSAKSSANIFSQIEEVTHDNGDELNMEKVKQGNEPLMIPKQDTKITVELEDDGNSSKFKNLISDSAEITAQEAEKLKRGSITEAMNKLKELRGYSKSKTTTTTLNTATETATTKRMIERSGNESLLTAGYNIADVPLPEEVRVISNVPLCAEDIAVPEIRTQEASTSAKINIVEKEMKRKKEILKRRWEEDEEDELSRLRYEALRSKTRRLMNDLRAERRRLKRERLRATIAMRRARERSVDASVDEILLADTSDTTETDDSDDDYSSSHKRKLMKRKRYGGGEVIDVFRNQNRSHGLEQRNYIADDGKQQHQNVVSSGNKEQLESNAPNNLILELQHRIGGSNESALALLEQLKKCLVGGGVVSSNIHLNPEVIRKNS